MDEGLHAWPWLAHTKHEFALALTARGRAGDQGRAEGLFAAAAASAERIGMPALQQKIRSRDTRFHLASLFRVEQVRSNG